MIITIGSHKGGTGKSTLAVNLAVIYQRAGRRVIVIEADPSVSTSSMWAARREAHDDLAPVTVLRKTGGLNVTLEGLEQAYDLVLVDTAGKDSAELRTAALVSNVLVIPTNADNPDLDSTSEFLARMDEARIINPALKMLVVITRAPTHAKSKHRDVAIAALEDNPEEFALADAVIFNRRIYPDALKEGRGVVEQRARTEQASEEMQALASEILDYAGA
ncbi:ParA family protein [uncultured Rothia sp.]|uniref:ParA family protein n=1 Tax=uncultured Rothia sp. TaxID=316088 RepID=UPI0025F63BA5|nr:ParA family protein [uncultured Rothia sp.]